MYFAGGDLRMEKEEWRYSPSPVKFYFNKTRLTQHTTFYVSNNSIQFQINNPCIYVISNMRTGKTYIGTTRTITSRIHAHYRQLLRGKHFCSELQRDFDAGDTFVCSIYKFGNSFYDEQTTIGEYMAKGIDLYNTCISKRAKSITE